MQLLRIVPSLGKKALRTFVPTFLHATGRLKMAPIPAARHPLRAPPPRLRRLFLVATAVAGLSFAANESQAQTTLGFDPPALPATTSFSLVPNGYGGLNWENVYYINRNYLAGSGYDHGTVSAPNAAFNGFGTVATVIDPVVGQFFNFASADLTSAWIPGLQVRIDGYNTSLNPVAPIRSTTVTVNPTGPTLFDFSTLGGGFNGINKLTFTSFVNSSDPSPNPAGTEFVMDDFKFTTTTTGGTPEPASLVLGVLGAAGLAVFARRSRNGRRAAA